MNSERNEIGTEILIHCLFMPTYIITSFEGREYTKYKEID